MDSTFSFLAAHLRSIQSLVTSLGTPLDVLVVRPDVQNLKNEATILEARISHMKRRILNEERQNKKRCLPEVKLWLDRAGAPLEQVFKFCEDFDDKQQQLRSPWLRFLASRRVTTLTEGVSKLIGESGFGALVYDQPQDDEQPLTTIQGKIRLSVAGNEETLHEILEYLGGHEAGILGIYGMGGVGKTRLLERVSYEFLTTSEFKMVIWASMSWNMDVRQLQEDICHQLCMTNLGCDCLFAELSSHVPFLLLLDNIWDVLDLRKVGIPTPTPENGCKIILTTRLKTVCLKMNAYPIQVKFLDEQNSLELFRKNVKNERIFGSLPFCAHIREIISKCGGLPLALTIVGRAMGTKQTLDEWREAAVVLKDLPKDIAYMEEKVFKVLKFSFDHMEDQLQQCFLYCSLFPERHEIDRGQLVSYWIGEGLLDCPGEKDIHQSYGSGHDKIEQLVATCLLQQGIDEGKVALHDMIRDLSLWISGRKFLVHGGFSSTSRKHMRGRFEGATRISFIHAVMPKLPEKPNCSELLTLLLNGSSLCCVPKDFFTYMPALLVLDLSDTKIEQLPCAIRKLGCLQYLNLSRTPIKSLPKEIGYLRKLRQLCLRSTSSLTSIPRRAVSGLVNLWHLDIFHCAYDLFSSNSDARIVQEKRLNFRDVEMLPELQELGIDVKMLHNQHIFLTSHMSKSTTSLCVKGLRNLSDNDLSQILGLKAVQELHLGECDELMDLLFCCENLWQLRVLKLFNLHQVQITWTRLETGKCNIRCLDIFGCHRLENITWVRHLLFLEIICLSDCHGLQELIDSGNVSGAIVSISFERLKSITLGGLPKLRSICDCPAMFHSLESLTIDECPELKQLPLQDQNCEKMREICGDRDWWETVQWESTVTGSKFSSLFRHQRSGAWKGKNPC